MTPLTATEIKSIEDAKAAFLAAHRELKEFTDKATQEIKASNSLSTETKNAVEALATKANEAFDRLDVLEARLNRRAIGATPSEDSLGQLFTKNEIFQQLANGKAKTGRLSVKTILNATGQNQPLVPAQRVPGIIAEPNRRLTVRDLLPLGRTGSNLIEFTKELVFTNSAGPQYNASPVETEGQRKNQSTITFELATAAVVTLAHFIKASKQVLADAPQLESYINGRLTYGLKLEEEDEILNGTGAAGTLNGLINQATTYNRGATNDTAIDTLRKSMTQAALSEYGVSGFVLNPADWEEIELTKDAENRYIFANPMQLAGPVLWGRPVVPTNSIPQGSFLAGAFDMCAQLWDREDAAVQVGYENDDFTRNLVTILAEERLALTVYRPAGLIKGSI